MCFAPEPTVRWHGARTPEDSGIMFGTWAQCLREDAGRWKEEEQNNGRPTDASARTGYAADGDPPSAIDLAGTACLAGILVRAKSGTHLAETPPTGKPDAGNPPVRFGGRGEVNPSSLPLSVVPGKMRPSEPAQYFGTAGSISSDQAVMPPLTLLRCLKPCSRRNCTRSEEHTSELQSRQYLVCRLLLE